jgi:hypothetical protein
LRFTASAMSVAIFWDIAPCSPYVNRCSEERITSICEPTVEMEVIRCFYTSVHIRTTPRYVPGEGNTHTISGFHKEAIRDFSLHLDELFEVRDKGKAVPLLN